ncbi:MAG: hypothetical protein ACK5PF_02130 [bacterium]
MRPAGEVRQALHRAACELVPRERMADPHAPRPTMREIAHRAQVGVEAARRTIENMTRAGDLKPAGTRRVDYCNKPVAVYEPLVYLDGAMAADLDARQGAGWVDLGRVVGTWAR